MKQDKVVVLQGLQRRLSLSQIIGVQVASGAFHSDGGKARIDPDATDKINRTNNDSIQTIRIFK